MTTTESSVWFVTGCSSGLGRAVAAHALAAGHRVVATARDATTLDDLVAGHGDDALALALDVTDPVQVRAAVRAAEDAFDGVDVLVNNAGYGYLAAIEEGEDAAVRALFDANVHGLVDVTKAVLPGMRRRRRGHVVNVSSLGGLAAFAATGYYHATKFAVEGLSESLAAEVAPLGIRVTIVEPGGLRTSWAGASMRKSATTIADYADTAGARRAATHAADGHQPGDPARAAAAIATVVAAEDPPVRLLLGTDALTIARRTLAARGAEIERWADLSASSDALAEAV